MGDAFKNRIVGYRGSGGRGSLGGPCLCCVETTCKRSRNRMARARLKQADYHVINDGIDAYETEEQESNDNCRDPHCCECGDGEGCEGCFFCERGKLAPGEDEPNL